MFFIEAIDFLDNISKYSYMFSQLCLCSAKWICFYCYNMFEYDYWLASRWVGGRRVGR